MTIDIHLIECKECGTPHNVEVVDEQLQPHKPCKCGAEVTINLVMTR